MLWTQVKEAVTPQGFKLTGEAEVRKWLKEKKALPEGDTSKVVAVAMADGITLRTEPEIEAWLKLAHECQSATIEVVDPIATSIPANRGKKTNVHSVPPRIEFFSDRAVVKSLTIAQWEDKPRIGVQVLGMGDERFSVELAYIGCKVGVRPSVRSVVAGEGVPAITPRYEYLSRVRLTRATNGIADPINDLNSGVHVIPPGPKGDQARVDVIQFTAVGLEWGHGEELILATLLDKDKAAIANAVLRLSVTKPSTDWVGAFRLFNVTADTMFLAEDPEFSAIYAFAPAKGTEVKVGVADSGLFDDASGRNYLASRCAAGKYFGAPAPSSGPDPQLEREDRPVKAEPPDTPHMVTANPSKHGTNVGAQAAFGSDKIKLLDVMVQKGQMAGAMNDETASRALKWAVDQGAAVVNCSKLLPFQKTKTHEVVEGAKDTTLFLASGGNKPFSFPLNCTTPIKKADFKADGETTDLPKSFMNTIWGGGCKQDRTPHESRGFGPAIDVMVPSDKLNLYTPLALVRAYRALSIRNFRTDVLAKMNEEKLKEPERTPVLKMNERIMFEELDQKERQAQADPSVVLSPAEATKLQGFRTRLAGAPPNPVRQRFDDARGRIDRLPTDDMKVWMDEFRKIQDGLDPKNDQKITSLLRERANAMEVNPAYEELKNAESAKGLANDDGISFGLPIVANIAAKLRLIQGDLTPNKLRRIMVDTSDYDPGFENQCMAKGIVNPLRAYFAAFDNNVSAGGKDPREYKVEPEAIDEARRVYYTVFHMGAENLRLYNSIKARLKRSYADVNIDLVEAEPPIEIKSEPITYVAGPAIKRHNWKAVVPVGKHPVLFADKHLRLMLFNECAQVLGSVYSTGGETHDISLSEQPAAPGKPPALEWVDAAGTSKTAVAADQRTDGGAFKCKFRLDPAKPNIFAKVLDHAVLSVKFGLTELAPDQFDVVRTTDREIALTVRPPVAPAAGTQITIELGILRPIGGSRDNRNISITTKYHEGPSGTPNADSSMLVLLLHEIGHALGMTPPHKPPPPAAPPPDRHQHYYESNYGGEGDHCSTNASPVNHTDLKPEWKITADSKDRASPAVMVPLAVINGSGPAPCVMYHTRTKVHHTSVFCDECRDWLRNKIDPKTWIFKGD
jgi:hypothetical protein